MAAYSARITGMMRYLQMEWLPDCRDQETQKAQARLQALLGCGRAQSRNEPAPQLMSPKLPWLYSPHRRCQL